MKIAVLGWGSLIWDPRSLRLSDDAWRPDGPLLPVEFLRVSSAGKLDERVTLVLSDDAALVRTLWSMSAFGDLDAARRDLASRERIVTDSLQKIGFVQREPPLSQLTTLTGNVRQATLDRIEKWLTVHQIDAAIWTDLSATLDDVEVVPKLRALAARPAGVSADDIRDMQQAENYVRRAPAQVRTNLRQDIEEAMGWLPNPIRSPIRTADDLRMKEWAECRTTIDRFDKILVDLRKVGFSFITALLGASAFFGFLGVSLDPTANLPPVMVRVAVFATLMTLVAALFAVDAYFESLLSGAVERALDLEAQTDPPIRITKYLTVNAVRAVWVTFGIYYVLFLLIWIFGSISTPPGPGSDLLAALTITIGSFIGVYTLYVSSSDRAGLGRSKKERYWPEGPGKIAAP